MIGLVISLSSVGKYIEYLLADSDTILILVLRVKGETSICTDERFGDTASLSGSSWRLSGSESVGNSIRDRRYLRFAWGDDAAVGCDDHGSSNFVRLEQADDDYSNQGEKIRAKKKLPANTVIFLNKQAHMVYMQHHSYPFLESWISSACSASSSRAAIC